MNAVLESTKTIIIPAILESNTYFWSPASLASGRRSNEKKRLAEMESFAETCMEILPGFECQAEYRESCKRVYKRFSVTRLVKGEWKKSNMTALKNALKKAGYLVK